MTIPDAQPTDVRRALAWAAFLGASWTWVIGMFLPVLLIRDFGPAGWFVFAIPNVVGAAAMGWVIRSREHSEAYVVNHRAAGQAFSLVTIAFHFYVLLWLVPWLIGPLPAAIAFGAALAVMLPLLTTAVRATTLAILALAASALIAVAMLGLDALHWPATSGVQSSFDLVALGLVCLLGFLTCPYLDLTFHRASQACRTHAESKVAFGVGFGVCFCSMIVFTLFYANVFLNEDLAATRSARAMIAVHLCLQSVLTVGLHAASFRNVTPDARRATASLVVAAVLPTALALGVHALGPATLGGMRVGEVAYRSFLAFYGLLAPAYVWLCVRRADAPPEPRSLRVAAIAVLVAAPFFWVAFMDGSMRWALPGVLALVAARIYLGVTRRNAEMRDRAFKALGGQFP